MEKLIFLRGVATNLHARRALIPWRVSKVIGFLLMAKKNPLPEQRIF